MAPIEIDPKDWSSNWKTLQARLKVEQVTNPPKRKAVSQNVARKEKAVKRQKFHEKPSGKEGEAGKTMGAMWSRYDPVGGGATKCHQNQSDGGHLSSSNAASTTTVPSSTSRDLKAPPPQPTRTSLAHLSSEHNIPASAINAAYGSTALSTSILTYSPEHPTTDIPNAGLSPSAQSLAGKYIALDCEMVGVGPTPNEDSALARISLVNWNGLQLYDSYVLPKEPVTDFRTHVSGITPTLLRTARTLEVVQAEVAPLLDGRILVGHALQNDLDALLLGHPRRDIRDTSKYPGYRILMRTKYPGLKRLAKEVLGVEIQSGEHNSVEDARVAMWLFRKEKEGFDREHVRMWGIDRAVKGAKQNGQKEEEQEGTKVISKRKKRRRKKK